MSSNKRFVLCQIFTSFHKASVLYNSVTLCPLLYLTETAVEVFKPDCSGLPQTCPQPPESDARDVKCDCQTVNCKKGEWEAWSATCGLATRKRKITTEQVWKISYAPHMPFLVSFVYNGCPSKNLLFVY